MAELPDHLLAAVLSHACSNAVDPEGPRAAAVVRNCAQVALVCRRFMALLREHPALLSLDFTDTVLTHVHMWWLARKSRFCSVRAAFFGELNSHFWRGPHSLFLENQARTLRELGGLPFRLVDPDRYDDTSLVLDPSDSAITCLTLTRWYFSSSLVAARLPACLEKLVLWSEGRHSEDFPVWSSAPGADPPGCLASLREVRCCASTGREDVNALAGLSRPGICLSLHSPGHMTLVVSDTPSGRFCGRALHVQAHRFSVEAEVISPAQVLDMLFAPGVQEVCLDCDRQHGISLDFSAARGNGTRSWFVCEERTICKLFMTRGSDFAFEASATRLAWRRWPPAGMPAWVAASVRHEAALAWCGGPFACLGEALKDLQRASEASSIWPPVDPAQSNDSGSEDEGWEADHEGWEGVN